MKLCVFAAGLATLFSSGIALLAEPPSDSGAGSEQSANQIRAVMESQEKAWNRGDLEGFMDGYARSEQTAFVAGDSVTRGWQTVLERYKKKYSDRAKMGTLTFSDLEFTQLAPDAVMVLGKWQLQLAVDRPHGVFTLLFRKLPEGWRIVQDHSSAAGG